MASPRTLEQQATVGNFTIHRLMPLREIDKSQLQNIGEPRVPQPTRVVAGRRYQFFDDGSVRRTTPKLTRAARKAARRARRAD